MEIVSVIPRGYCQGVVRAIRIAASTAKEYPDQKIYMLGMIVHNAYVVEACKKIGIRFIEDPGKTRLELLDEIDEGVVIFTAHGVSDAVRKKAEEKNLIVVDATCPDVIKTHDLAKEHAAIGHVLYIGKKNHPEAEGTTGLSERIHLISTKEDLQELPDYENVLITTQTTLSLLDTQDLLSACLEKYPDAKVMQEICNATRIRQEAVMKLKDTDLLIVVGDPRSNNSRQLAETGKRVGIKECMLIENVNELTESAVKDKKRIAVTSGSSTPNELTAQVISFLKAYAENGIWDLPQTINQPVL